MEDQSDIFVSRLRNKDKNAFEIVFNQYYKTLCGYANKYLDDTDVAEEIVQEVFVKFWEKCESIAPDSSIKSYLYRSVHNTCLNHIKHLKVRDNYRQYVMVKMETESYNFFDDVEDTNLEKKIYDAIDELPPQCQKIFKLSRFEGLKYQEIADHLGLSIKTIEVQMGKALKVLRQKLRAYIRIA
ncbi:MAG: RNA polymerase sigma-70 factor [Cyclobacteriaceae bacterium]|nr:RNA polymerase sigma-70 factor [Cyclobacteriaceae bacterium]